MDFLLAKDAPGERRSIPFEGLTNSSSLVINEKIPGKVLNQTGS